MLKAAQLRDQINSLGVECELEGGDVAEYLSKGLKKWAKRPAGGGAVAPLEGRVTWAAALAWLNSQGYFVEVEKDPQTHSPLLSRSVGLSYEEKLGNMKGKKLQRHQSCMEKGVGVNDKAFYEKMQGQGSTQP
jgi:hypothetical protein